jgi:hypothetical protein
MLIPRDTIRHRFDSGAYPHPAGGYLSESVSPPDKRARRIRIRAVHRAQVDPKAVAQVVIAIAVEQAQAERDKLAS